MPDRAGSPNLLTEAFRRAAEALSGSSSALIGGLAVAFHGLARATRDIDLLLSTPRIALPLKMIAGREDDLRDIRGILATQGDALDLGRIRLAIAECCEEGRGEVFERLLAERDRGSSSRAL